MISTKGLSKAEVLATLYNHSKTKSAYGCDSKPMTSAEAEVLLKTTTAFDYVRGRMIGTDLTRNNEFDERGYDSDNGKGAAQAAIDETRRNKILFNRAPALERYLNPPERIRDIGRLLETMNWETAQALLRSGELLAVYRGASEHVGPFAATLLPNKDEYDFHYSAYRSGYNLMFRLYAVKAEDWDRAIAEMTVSKAGEIAGNQTNQGTTNES